MPKGSAYPLHHGQDPGSIGTQLVALWSAGPMVDPAFAPLRDSGATFVPGDGNWLKPEIALVGEAPGRQEDEQGRPFVGMSGDLLWRHFSEVLEPLTREDTWTTNVVKYRPPANRTPTWTELTAGAGHLRRELALVEPLVMVTLGNSPLSVMRPGAKIGQVHGQAFTMKSGRFCFPLYHPAYLLRRRDLVDEFRADLAALRRLIEEYE